jgi:hypothetical protein
MNVPARIRVLARTCIGVALVTALLVLAVPATGALAAEVTIKYKDENGQEFERQLNAHEIKAATFNKRIRSLHITLKNGEHFRYRYPTKTVHVLAAQLAAKGVPVTVLTPEEAKKEASKAPIKHKLRYIAGGILIVVIVVVGGVLIWNRRRKRLAE